MAFLFFRDFFLEGLDDLDILDILDDLDILDFLDGLPETQSLLFGYIHLVGGLYAEGVIPHVDM